MGVLEHGLLHLPTHIPVSGTMLMCCLQRRWTNTAVIYLHGSQAESCVRKHLALSREHCSLFAGVLKGGDSERCSSVGAGCSLSVFFFFGSTEKNACTSQGLILSLFLICSAVEGGKQMEIYRWKYLFFFFFFLSYCIFSFSVQCFSDSLPVSELTCCLGNPNPLDMFVRLSVLMRLLKPAHWGTVNPLSKSISWSPSLWHDLVLSGMVMWWLVRVC